MKNQLLFIFLLICSFCISAQEVESTTAPLAESNDRPECTPLTVKPIYPMNELRFGKQGTVVVKVTIDNTGKIIEVKVLESSKNSNLDQAAITAVSSSTFCPGYKDGKAVGGTVIVPVRFTANMIGS